MKKLFCLFALCLSLNVSALQIVSVQSCLHHTSVGILCQAAPSGYVEPRVSDTYSLLFIFDAPITVLPAIFAADQLRNDVPIISAEIVGGDLLVSVQPLDTQTVEIALNTGSSFMSTVIAFLAGDVNGDGTVTQVDVDIVKLFSGQPTNSANFLNDINVNGAINSTDALAVKARIGHHL